MIYISLTTVPIRLNSWEHFQKNLISLLNQDTNKDYKVLLNIPYKYKNNNDEEYLISENLTNFLYSNPKLILNRVEKDYGPVVKITGALQYVNDPEDILIVCDDDHIYHKDMLEYHLKKLNEYDGHMICFRGDNCIEKREWNENGDIKYTLSPTHFYFPVKYDAQVRNPGHWHSVSYKRKYFENDFMEDSFLSLATNDDVLTAYYFYMKERHFIVAKWENETDWRPVNDNGRPSHSFPIVEPLPFHNSGFYEFRVLANDGYGYMDEKVRKGLTQNNHKIYIQK